MNEKLNKLDLIKDEITISVSELLVFPHASRLKLFSCLPILISPDTRKGLELVERGGYVTDGEFNYPLKNNCPILYPRKVIEAWQNDQIPSDMHRLNSVLQYFCLSQIKQAGENNAPTNTNAYERLLSRMRRFCSDLKGVTVDVGCDSPSISAAIFPENCQYIGVDPFAVGQEFKVIGVGECLPFKNQCIDNVCFNTSLDHILDYHTAIDEAHRVLKPGWKIVICTFAWLNKASLLTDSTHFHHFREHEIMGCLSGFNIMDIKRYESPKDDRHRYVLYVCAAKNGTNEYGG